jgi:hypothetical protein
MWNEKLRELTDGRGIVDCVVEIGGPGTIAMSLKALDVGGHISLIGGRLSRSGGGLDPRLLTRRGIRSARSAPGRRTDCETMNRAIAMHPCIPLSTGLSRSLRPTQPIGISRVADISGRS